MHTITQRKANRIAAGLTGLVLVAGALVGAQSASAANNCTYSEHACLWGFDDFTSLVATKRGGAGLSNLTGAGIANETASWGNDSSYYGCIYDNTNGTGASWTITPRSSRWFGLIDRDRAESWKLNGMAC